MIDEKRLLCAFIYSAYSSGYCGLGLGDEKRKEHMELYKNYIKEGKYYPEKETKETQVKMMDHVNASDARDYIYNKHFDVVINRIEEESNRTFKEAVKSSPMIASSAINCPPNFYEVIQSDEGVLVGKNIISGIERRLFILEGLEKPKQGDLVSGHWDIFLEIVNNLPNLEKYKKMSLEHYKKIKEALKKE